MTATEWYNILCQQGFPHPRYRSLLPIHTYASIPAQSHLPLPLHICHSTSSQPPLSLVTCRYTHVLTQLHNLVWNVFISVTIWSTLSQPWRSKSDVAFHWKAFLSFKGRVWYFFFCSQHRNLHVSLLKYLPYCVVIICFFLINPQFLNQIVKLFVFLSIVPSSKPGLK